MFLAKNDYDRGVNTFSPEGRLFQVEYALEAIKLGSTAIGMVCSEGVVLGVERRVNSKLIVPSSIEKIYEVDNHIGVATSGIVSDARTLVDHAIAEAQGHRFSFGEPMRVSSLTQSVCDVVLNFGEGDGSKNKPMARPYGVSLLVAGMDGKTPALLHTDPSGTYISYKAKAIGSAAEGAQILLQEQYHQQLTLEDAITMTLSILKRVMEDKINQNNVEICVIPTENPKYRSLPVDEVQGYLNRL